MSDKVTFQVKVEKPVKEFTEEILTDIMDAKGITKGEAFKELVTERIDSEPIRKATGKASDTLESIKRDCPFISYNEDLQFECYRDTHKNQKIKVLGIEPDAVLLLCDMCLKGTSKVKEDKLMERADKENVKRLEAFMKNVLQLTSGGIQTDAFICLADVVDGGQLTFSYDGILMRCKDFTFDNEGIITKQNISIEDYCKHKINPSTKEPGCPHFAKLPHLVKITAKDFQEHDIHPPELINPQLEEQEETPSNPKIVDAEYEPIKEEIDDE